MAKKNTVADEAELLRRLEATPKDKSIETVLAALYLGLSKSTLEKKRVYGGGPPFIKDGRAVRYTLRELDAFRESKRVHSTSEYVGTDAG